MQASSDPRYSLLVIDMLTDFFERSAALSHQRPHLVSRINSLTRAFRDQQQLVIWVRQEFRTDLKDAFLEMRRNVMRVTIGGTEGCQILPDLEQYLSIRCTERLAEAGIASSVGSVGDSYDNALDECADLSKA